MQVEENHLVSAELFDKIKTCTDEEEKKLLALQNNLSELDSYEELPKDLTHAAKVALRGKDSVFVSKTSGGKLSKYAAKRRRRKMRGK
jgi:hypothetical protein